MKHWLVAKGGVYVLVQFALFALIALAPDSVIGEWPPWLAAFGRILGIPLALFGLAMLIAGFISLGRNLQAEPHPKENASLVTDGAYRIVRHPLYAGILCSWLGLALYQQHDLTVILLLTILLPFFNLKIKREERMLVAKFPEYAQYQQQVKKLFPLLF